MMTMVFAVEEINSNSSLLPGVKLGYRIMDSCDHVHTSLQSLLSLVSPSKAVPNKVDTMQKNVEKTEKLPKATENEGAVSNIADKTGNYKSAAWSEVTASCLTGSTVPAVIGLASSSPTRAVAHTLGPFNIPLVRAEGQGKKSDDGSFSHLTMISYSTLSSCR